MADPLARAAGAPDPSQSVSENRRAATRHPILLEATLALDGETSEEELHNLSLGGAFVTAARRLPLGQRVELSFRIPTLDEPIRIGAQVRWTTESGAGVQFDGLRAREVWSLNKYFDELDR